MPELRIIAGANGSGKSSLTKLSTISIPIIDPDAIDRERTVIYMQELPGWIDRANLNL